MNSIWESIFIKPIFNLLVAIYSFLPLKDLGISVILLVMVVRLILFPLSKKASRTQFMLQKLQPEVEEIQKKYKGNREAETKALLALYRDHEINPFSGILILFLQLPILFALYRVFLNVVSHSDQNAFLLWSFIPDPGKLNPTLLGIVDLSTPSVLLAFLASLVQFFQTKLMMPSLSQANYQTNSMQKIFARQMIFIGPLITLIALVSFPAVIGIYWLVSSLWSLLEYRIIFHSSLYDRKSKSTNTT